MERIKKIGDYCRIFRVETLQTTLILVGKETNTNIKTLSAFECGRSNNIEHVLKYVDACNDTQKQLFLNGLIKVMAGK